MGRRGEDSQPVYPSDLYPGSLRQLYQSGFPAPQLPGMAKIAPGVRSLRKIAAQPLLAPKLFNTFDGIETRQGRQHVTVIGLIGFANG